jgi:hypothetical protein
MVGEHTIYKIMALFELCIIKKAENRNGSKGVGKLFKKL